MSRILILVSAMVMLVSPAFAKDDGGFGAVQFPVQAPAALGDYVAGDIASPASIEPAAGDEEDVAPAEEALDTEMADPAVVPVPHVDTPDTKDAPQE